MVDVGVDTESTWDYMARDSNENEPGLFDWWTEQLSTPTLALRGQRKIVYIYLYFPLASEVSVYLGSLTNLHWKMPAYNSRAKSNLL